MFRHILVPLDFSASSSRALEIAVALAGKLGSRLTLMHAYVVPVYPLPEGFVQAPADTIATIVSATETAMGEALLRAKHLGATDATTLITEGPAASEITRVAAELGADLVVMGTHGRTGLKHALLGSVAERIVRKAPCAVMTVRADTP